ncbi:MAG: molybdopterin-dependent oxidoreductase [Candidatus Kapaibacterium sp.]
MNPLSRRKFLKISAATFGAATAATSVGMVSRAQFLPDVAPDGKVEKIPTFCSICFWKCGAIGYKKDGKLWKVEGNPIDPLSNGRLCPRGTGGTGAHYNEDRLKAPLIRRKKDGKEQWVEVTWDEALDFIAKKMNKIKAEYGPQSMAMFSHGIGGNFLKHMIKAYGSNNIVAPSFAQCRGPRDVGWELTYGDVIGTPERTDIENTRCMALIGSHLGENMHNTQVQEFSHAIERGASIIVVDPRFSIAASKAKYYLPIKPGTDIALLLAWMNVMVDEEIYDKAFIEKYGFGFEQFKAEISRYTPEWAFPHTGIQPDLIRQSARELAKNKPASFVHPGRHVTWWGDDTQRSRAIGLVNALLGNWNHKGAFYQAQGMFIPPYPYPDYPEYPKQPVDNPDHKYPFAHAGHGITNGVRDATISGDPYPIKGWLVYATNLMQALPSQEETLKAINNLDLMVVVDVIPSEIAGYADVVLPESIYLERYDDLNAPWFREQFVSLRQPVVEAPDDQQPNWWIAKKLADKLGIGHYFPWKNVEEYLSYRVEKAGLSWQQLKKDGVIKGPKYPLFVEDGVELQFYTPSGKIEFYSLQLQEKGFDPIPKFNKPEDPPPGYFHLLYGRSPVHTFSRTQTNPILSDMMDENSIWININIARKYGLKDGDYIKLKNQDGVVSTPIRVKATERIRPDTFYMVHGFGHMSPILKKQFLVGASDARLITRYNVDPLMGGTGMNVNYVTIELEA